MGPQALVAALREQHGTEQMATFAEALIERNAHDRWNQIPVIAAAYMLGRTDAASIDAVPSIYAQPMAERVLEHSGFWLKLDGGVPAGLPF